MTARKQPEWSINLTPDANREGNVRVRAKMGDTEVVMSCAGFEAAMTLATGTLIPTIKTLDEAAAGAEGNAAGDGTASPQIPSTSPAS